MQPYDKLKLPSLHDALPGRQTPPHAIPARHEVLGTPLQGPFPAMSFAMFALGCFWGAERRFWQLSGVHSTQVGYAGGHTANPTYDEVCSGRTGHAEVVRVVFDPTRVGYEQLLRVFWESHDPTQGMQQGNDLGTQYRSIIFAFSGEQQTRAAASRLRYQRALSAVGFGAITTEIREAAQFYFAEPEHQQYLAKNPQGYCGLGGTKVAYVDEDAERASEPYALDELGGKP